jgi:hypothetical protein
MADEDYDDFDEFEGDENGEEYNANDFEDDFHEEENHVPSNTEDNSTNANHAILPDSMLPYYREETVIVNDESTYTGSVYSDDDDTPRSEKLDSAREKFKSPRMDSPGRIISPAKSITPRRLDINSRVSEIIPDTPQAEDVKTPSDDILSHLLERKSARGEKIELHEKKPITLELPENITKGLHTHTATDTKNDQKQTSNDVLEEHIVNETKLAKEEHESKLSKEEHEITEKIQEDHKPIQDETHTTVDVKDDTHLREIDHSSERKDALKLPLHIITDVSSLEKQKSDDRNDQDKVVQETKKDTNDKKESGRKGITPRDKKQPTPRAEEKKPTPRKDDKPWRQTPRATVDAKTEASETKPSITSPRASVHTKTEDSETKTSLTSPRGKKQPTPRIEEKNNDGEAAEKIDEKKDEILSPKKEESDKKTVLTSPRGKKQITPRTEDSDKKPTMTSPRGSNVKKHVTPRGDSKEKLTSPRGEKKPILEPTKEKSDQVEPEKPNEVHVDVAKEVLAESVHSGATHTHSNEIPQDHPAVTEEPTKVTTNDTSLGDPIREKTEDAEKQHIEESRAVDKPKKISPRTTNKTDSPRVTKVEPSPRKHDSPRNHETKITPRKDDKKSLLSPRKEAKHIDIEQVHSEPVSIGTQTSAREPMVPLEEKYLQSCRKRECKPNSRVMAQIRSGTFGAKGIIDMSANYLGEEGVCCVLDVLGQVHCSTLNFKQNGITNAAVKTIVSALTANQTITNINLSSNEISITGVIDIIMMIKATNHIKVLDLSDNYIDQQYITSIERLIASKH